MTRSNEATTREDDIIKGGSPTQLEAAYAIMPLLLDIKSLMIMALEQDVIPNMLQTNFETALLEISKLAPFTEYEGVAFLSSINVLDAVSTEAQLEQLDAELTSLIELIADLHEADKDQIISGTRDDDIIKGGNGNDTIDGGRGNDIIDGGYGNDTIDGGYGDDVIKGGYGNDIINDSWGDDLIKGGYGNDIINGSWGDDLINGGYGDDIIDAGWGDDIVKGGHGDDIITAFAGDDIIKGGEGNDTINGDSGNDTLYGGAGNDVFNEDLTGGMGNDMNYGGSGDDIFLHNGFNPAVYIPEYGILRDEGWDTYGGGTGFDSIILDQVFFGVRWGEIKIKSLNNVEAITNNDDEKHVDILVQGYIDLSDTILTNIRYVNGHSGQDEIIGSAGHDHLRSKAGNDHLRGKAGNDTLDGGTGDDVIEGGSGADVLNGGTGNDTLTGGNGADQFIFNADQSTDTVTDFQAGVDQLMFLGVTSFSVANNADGDAEFEINGDTYVVLTGVDVSLIDTSDYMLV